MTLVAAGPMIPCGLGRCSRFPGWHWVPLRARRRVSCGNARCLAVGALVAARWSSPSVCRLRRPWQLEVFSRRAAGISGEAEAEGGEAAEVEIRKKGLDESALNLDPEQLLEKLEFTSPRLAQQIRRIDAVDGKELTLRNSAVSQIVDDNALDRARHARRRGAFTIVHNEGRLLHFDNHLTMGGIACAMSHRLALQAVVQHPTAKWGIILEDDVLAMLPNAEEVVAKTIATLPSDWDALFLGYHDDAGRPHPGISNGMVNDLEVPVRPMREPCFGLFAWVVRREAAQELLANAFPIGGQVDHALSSWLVRARGRCFQVEPGSMVFFSPKSEEAEDSDIQTMATVDAFMQKFESWQAYYEHVWGLDSIMDGYLLSESEDYEDLEDWQDEFMTPFSPNGSTPPCDAPTPECSPDL